ANYWKFYKLIIINDPYGVFLRDSSNNYFESIVTHDNYETGFQMQGTLSNNQIVYLDSFRNRDPRNNGESADGSACKDDSGTGNILKGVRIWENGDDSLDLWEFKPPVTIMDTISWGNGVNQWGFSDFQGDGVHEQQAAGQLPIHVQHGMEQRRRRLPDHQEQVNAEGKRRGLQFQDDGQVKPDVARQRHCQQRQLVVRQRDLV
ncbi:putative pectate lyase L, partial [Colletotrichum sublineola]